MPAAAQGQDPVIHGLGINADPPDPMAGQNLELLLGDGIRPSGLHRVFQAAGKIQAPAKDIQEPVQLACREGGGGAAAYIECTSPEPGTCQHSAHPLNFPDQSLEVGLHHSTGAGGGRADKAAVGAAGGAKGNSHIEGNIPGPQQLSRLDCSLGGLQAQLPPGGRDVVNLLQHSPGSPEGPSLHQELGGNLRRAHAGQGPPGGRLRQQRTGGSVIASLQQAPPQLHRLRLQMHPADTLGFPAPVPNDRGGC